ncbi:TetR/AcrR family transcriptional regulator [Paractinoplanes brasiliensis]|nr:TetR/AcrR family transcriptional regulator [Actinoplanes brasiliensis]
MSEHVPHLPRPLRADARENRDRVLESARVLFSEQGLGVTMRQVARRAEVGPATLYRRFPTKQVLVEAAFADEVRACRGIVEGGCAAEDPWLGFCSVIEGLTVLNARNHGFTEAFMAAAPDVDMFAAHRASLLRMLAGLVGRAQDAGALRGDFVVDDLVLVLLAGRGLSSLPLRLRDKAARRFAALSIDGFRASDANRRLPRAPRLTTGASIIRNLRPDATGTASTEEAAGQRTYDQVTTQGARNDTETGVDTCSVQAARYSPSRDNDVNLSMGEIRDGLQAG